MLKEISAVFLHGLTFVLSHSLVAFDVWRCWFHHCICALSLLAPISPCRALPPKGAPLPSCSLPASASRQIVGIMSQNNSVSIQRNYMQSLHSPDRASHLITYLCPWASVKHVFWSVQFVQTIDHESWGKKAPHATS